jgi:hypothetical protein
MMLALLFCSLFAAPVLSAQEEATAEATEAVEGETEAAAEGEAQDAIESEGEISETAGNVPGVSAAMLFLGAGAIVLVGLLMIARDNFRGDADTNTP